MISAWFDWLTDLSFRLPGLSVVLALASGLAAGATIWFVILAVMWVVFWIGEWLGVFPIHVYFFPRGNLTWPES